MNLPVRPAGRVPGLDLLRSLAIVLVVAYHSWAKHPGDWANGAQQGAADRILAFGWAGVDLFFVLSGYLIGNQVWRELQTTGRFQAARFLLARGLRIWPLYYLSLAIFSLIGEPTPYRLWPEWLFLSNYHGEARIHGSWSLATEEQFYLGIALFVWVGAKLRLPRSCFLALVVGALLTQPWLRHLRWSSIDTSGVDPWRLMFTTVYGPIHLHADGLLTGIFIAWSGLARARLSRGLLVWGVLLAGAFVLRRYYAPAFSYSFNAVLFGGMTWAVLAGGFSRWRTATLEWTSKLSFGIYLVHSFIISRLLSIEAYKPSLGALFLLAFGLSFAFAAVTYRWVESPILRWRDRAFRPGADSQNNAASLISK